MESMKVKTKSGKEVYIVKIDEKEGMSEIDGEGMCIACGSFQSGVEPDARKYECESCGEEKVYGIEELFIMGYSC